MHYDLQFVGSMLNPAIPRHSESASALQKSSDMISYTVGLLNVVKVTSNAISFGSKYSIIMSPLSCPEARPDIKQDCSSP